MLLLYGALYFAVGYFEETIFRGYLLQNFSALWGKSGGIAAQAITFALIHLMNPVETTPFTRFFAMLNIALVGWLLALCYRKSGSLWYPIGFHVAWNFFQGCVFSLPVSGAASFHLLDVSVTKNTLLSGGAFGPEAGVLPPLMLLALILLAQRLPDHARVVAEIEALRRGDDMHSAPELVTPETVPPLFPEEASAAPREYSPPRYKASLSAAPRRATAIDWSDVNTRGGAAQFAFTPGVAPMIADGNATIVTTATEPAVENASAVESVSVVEAETSAAAPVEFTPQSAPRVVFESVASTRDTFERDAADERNASLESDASSSPRQESARDIRSVAGEAPLPAGARVMASRSNFGGAPRDNAARVLAAESTAEGETASPNETRKIDAAPPLPSPALSSPNSPQSAAPLSTTSPHPIPAAPTSGAALIAGTDPTSDTKSESQNRDNKIEGDDATRRLSAPPPLPTAPPSTSEPRENATSTRGAATSETPRLLPAPPALQSPSEDAASTRAQAEIEVPPRILATDGDETASSAPPTSDAPPETRRATPRW